MSRYEYLCTICPRGCLLEVEVEDQTNTVTAVRGWACKRGEAYGRQEHTNPRRKLTTTVAIEGGLYPRLPVRTSAAAPKSKLLEIAREAHQLHLKAPIRHGEVLIENVADSGTDLVAGRNMPAMAKND